MSDRYAQLANSRVGSLVVKNVGLPKPVELERYEPGRPLATGPVVVGEAPGGRLTAAAAQILEAAGVNIVSSLSEEERADALVFDASGIADSTQLRELHSFFQPLIRKVRKCGRVVVLGTPPEDCASPREATAQRALEGFTRSVAKEIRGGSTAQLVYVAPEAENQLASTLRFLLSRRSAYVSGQVVRIGTSPLRPAIDYDRPLDGKVALVTGASRGIGEAIATVLARDGAHVVGVDVPALGDELAAVIARISGSALTVDITAGEAPEAIVRQLTEQHGGVDVVVHNAGITRDKTLGNMGEDLWTSLMEVNLSAPERINDALLAADAIREGGRIIGVASISGIAGNSGQTNYATSKAGVIGMVQSLAPGLAERNITINAVAPGFIETQMTAAMPLTIREAGRRMNSLSQGGLPVDVAETIAWFASPASAGVNGNVVRVCGQSLLGA
jgi:3-oxoacyl-[acyl-carrier protein] reductase